jgi:hypothetical protein
MPHLYNQKAFASLDITSPLLHSYIRLIGIEIALKNFDLANWGLGHQIDTMIAGLGNPALLALVQRLQARLTKLWCEKKGGGATYVSGSNFPTLRYLRHVSDFVGSTDASSDTELLELRDVIEDLATELKREGILT